MKPQYLMLPFLLVVLTGSSGCIPTRGSRAERTGKTQREMLLQPIGEARSAIICLRMGAGEVNLSGGALGLLDGALSYNIPDWKPRVSYDVIGHHQGMLTVSQPTGAHSNFYNNRVHYAWDLRVNKELPIGISLGMHAGRADLDLAGTALTNLDVRMGVGNLEIDLSGNWEHNLAVSIEDRVGTTTVRLPRHIGVRVFVGPGLRKVDAIDFKQDRNYYFNDAYGSARITVEMRIDQDLGEIKLQLVGGHHASQHVKTGLFTPKVHNKVNANRELTYGSNFHTSRHFTRVPRGLALSRSPH